MITLARHVDIEGTHNTRDLGGLPLIGGGHTSEGRVWRSDGFGQVTPAATTPSPATGSAP